MPHAMTLAAALLALAPAAPDTKDGPDPVKPTLEQIFDPPRLLGTRPQDAAPSADGAFVVFRRVPQDREEAKSDWYAVAAQGGEPRLLFEAKDEARCWWTRSGSRLLVLRRGWLELLDVAAPQSNQSAGSGTRPLLEVGSRLDGLTFLDDGKRIAFVAGEDSQLFVLDLESGERRAPASSLEGRGGWFQVLSDQTRAAVFARPADSEEPEKDAAKEESKAETKPKAAEGPAPAPARANADSGAKKVLWLVTLDGSAPPKATKMEEGGEVHVAPSGRFALRENFDRTEPRQLVMADYLTSTVTTVRVRSSLPGDPAAKVDFEIHDLESGKQIDLPLDAGEHYWTFDATFAKASDVLLVDRISNDSKVRQVLMLDPATKVARLVHAERDEAWIGGPSQRVFFSADAASVFFTSEETGFNHLYRCAADGSQKVSLTAFEGAGEVRSVTRIGDSDRFLVAHNQGDSAAWSIDLVDGGKGERRTITPKDGVAERGVANHAGTVAVWSQEFLGVPADLYSARLDAAAEPLRLTATQPPELAALGLAPPEIVEYENPRDGTKVRAYVYRPPGLAPGTRCPCVVFAHGAGYLQQVMRSMTAYEPNYLFHHRLARKGYVVLDPDYRHSAGYGRKFRTDVWGHLGGKDLDDIVAGIEHLAKQGIVDPARVGIYGGSYGGFLTLMALFTRSDAFAAGCAMRSVTDWRSYNAWYTNPRLGDPKDDAANYERSSPIDHAKGLEKPLLLLHGLKDRNVFAQDTIRLIEKLIELRKDFDAMIYPSQDHGFSDPDAWVDEYRRIERFFDRHLAGTGGPR